MEALSKIVSFVVANQAPIALVALYFFNRWVKLHPGIQGNGIGEALGHWLAKEAQGPSPFKIPEVALEIAGAAPAAPAPAPSEPAAAAAPQG